MQIIFGDCQTELEKLKDNSVDCIITDPPYRYLDHKLDTNFDREKVFTELYRVLKNNSFISVFGRGAELCKDVVCMEKLGFKFKEEIVWNKHNISNWLCDLKRQHELCFILVKGQRRFNEVRIDYFDYLLETNALHKLKDNYNRIKQICKKKNIEELVKYFKDGTVEYKTKNKSHFHLTHDAINQSNASISTIQKIKKGTFLRSIIDCRIESGKYKVPTQKPQELLRRLILLTSNENDIILDPFCGSGSLGLAAKQIDRDFILIEKDEEYYNIAKQNIEEYLNNSLFK